MMEGESNSRDGSQEVVGLRSRWLATGKRLAKGVWVLCLQTEVLKIEGLACG